MNITEDKVKAAEQVLIDNGIDADEASTVLQALGFALLDQDLYPPKYRARCIQWDAPDGVGKHLDSEVTVSFEDLQLPDNATDEEIEYALSEYITNEYGFCHKGFIFEKIEA